MLPRGINHYTDAAATSFFFGRGSTVDTPAAVCMTEGRHVVRFHFERVALTASSKSLRSLLLHVVSFRMMHGPAVRDSVSGPLALGLVLRKSVTPSLLLGCGDPSLFFFELSELCAWRFKSLLQCLLSVFVASSRGLGQTLGRKLCPAHAIRRTLNYAGFFVYSL